MKIWVWKICKSSHSAFICILQCPKFFRFDVEVLVHTNRELDLVRWDLMPVPSVAHSHTFDPNNGTIWNDRNMFAYTHPVYWKGKVCIFQTNSPKWIHWHTVSWSPLPVTAGPKHSCKQTKSLEKEENKRSNRFSWETRVGFETHPLPLWGWAFRRIIAGSKHLHSVWFATFTSTGSGTNLNGITLRT